MNTILDEVLNFENQQFGFTHNPVGRQCNCAKHMGLEDAPRLNEFEIIGSDNRIEIPDTTVIPNRYICNIELDGWAIGTGTLINRRTVLTAGHVVTTGSGRLEDKTKFRVIPGRKGSYLPWGAATVEQIFVASGFAQGSSTDYALIRLREPLGQGLGFWGSTAATAITNGTSINNNSPITVCGYPADKPYDPAMKCWNRSVNTFRRCYHTSPYNSTHGRNRLCGTFQFASYDGIVESVQAGKIIHYTSDTCPAHSGSPVWLYFPHNKSRVLIGVHITGDDGVGAVANRAVLIDSSVRSFIRQYSV